MKTETLNASYLFGTSGSTLGYNTWSEAERVEVNEVGESIEMVYKQTSMVSYTTYPPIPQGERVFKIVYNINKLK